MTLFRAIGRPVSSRAMPRRKPLIANDNKPDAPSMQRFAWDVYRAAARARWIGRVISSTADEAIEAAAVEFKTDAWKLIAVRRFEIA
jgi:hypothetical protein